VVRQELQHLPRYGSILEGGRTPQFVHARLWEVEFDPLAPSEELWALHAREAARLRGSGALDGPPDPDDPPGLRSLPEGARGLLDLKLELARRLTSPCALCERRCLADRAGGRAGACGVLGPRVSSSFLHHGEEAELVPSHTIFLAGCNLECQFCQNWEISRRPRAGEAVGPEDLVALILGEERRSRNVNWVGGDPIPDLHAVLGALRLYGSPRPRPQVWNSNMYMTEEALGLLESTMDVYLTDFKYGSDACAERLSRVGRYTEVVGRNHRGAHRQAELLVRHLVMPGHVDCCSLPVLEWLRRELGPVRVNVMGQYRPDYHAHDHGELRRRPAPEEVLRARRHAESLGLLGLD
jgi:putative pyruvate formate lyase activating enzyme